MPWLQLSLDTTAEHADTLSDLLTECGAAAVTLQDRADDALYEPAPGETPLWNSTRVTGLFDAEVDVQTVTATLHAAFGDGLPDVHVDAVEDRVWEREWLKHFHCMQFGSWLWICPSWETPPEPEALNIVLDPGLAFGTGTHPTTALCLEWLDAHGASKQSVIDYGCGSGVLAIAAALLGAGQVRAVDIDPQALEATGDNAARNGVAGRIITCSPDELPPLPVDLVLANILAGPLQRLAPQLAQLTAPGGWIVLSGVLTTQAEEVCEAYRPWFELEAPAIREDWVRIAGRRRDVTQARQPAQQNC